MGGSREHPLVQNRRVTAEQASPSIEPARGKKTRTLAWIAIGFGVVSLPGLLGFVPGLPDSIRYSLLEATNLAPITAVVSWLLALIAALISGIRLVPRTRTRSTAVSFAMTAPGAILGSIAIVMAFTFVGGLLGVGKGNVAQDLAVPVMSTYSDAGGSLLCTNGDGGYGPSNRQPWYQAYLDVPANIATEQQARDALIHAGFDDVTPAEPVIEYDEPTPDGSFAFSTATQGGTMTVAVHTLAAVPLLCGVEGYGEEHVSAPGRALVSVYVSLPDRE